MLDIRLLGRFSVRRAGEEIPPASFNGRLVRTLVRVLVTRRGAFVPRDVLAEALWPGRAPADPTMNVNVLISRARSALGDPSLILTGPGGYSFASDDRCIVDAEVFLAQVGIGRERLVSGQAGAALAAFQQAIELWGGEPLAEDAYEKWAQEYRSILERRYLEALEQGATAALAVEDLGQAVALAEMAVAREPLREAAHLLLVRALATCGDTAAALAAFTRFRKRLVRELGLDPSPEALALEGRILRGEPLGSSRRRPLAVALRPAFDELIFVGRDEELRAVLGVVGAPIHGTAVVSGLSGSGKSRLLAEVVARSRTPVVAVRGFPGEREEAWALARTLLREVLSVAPDAALAIPDRAAQAVIDIVPELEELRPIGNASLDSQSRRALAIQGAVRLAEAVASKGAVMIVDDLQCSDPTSLQLLRQVVQRVSKLGVTLAYRAEDVPPEGHVAAFLADLAELTTQVYWLALEPLPIQAICTLVADEVLARVIAEETDRTPLAVTEVLRGLAREGAIDRDAQGSWRAKTKQASRLARQAARAGQRQAIRVRTERQSWARRETLCLLALRGRETPARVLAAAREEDQTAILDDLDALARAGLVRLGEEGWAVTHDIIGGSVTEGIDHAERGRLHQMLARALRADGADPSELARHLAAAGDRGAAAEAFVQAGRRSLDRYANEEAERLADAGLQLEPAPLIRSALLEIRAEARARAGDIQGAREDLRAALAARDPGPDRSRILTRIAMLISGSEDYLHAGELVELALTEAGDDAGARAEALAVGAIMDTNMNRLDQAEARCTEALSLFEQVRDARGVASILDARATLALGQGRIREAVETFGSAARRFHDSGMLLRVGTAGTNRGFGLLLMNSAQEGLAAVEEALTLERMLGNVEGETLCLGIRSLALCALGRCEEAKESIEPALVVARQLGHREFTAAGCLILGIVCQTAGELDQAEASLREAIGMSRDMPIYWSWGAARLACVLIAQGDLTAAESWVKRALAEAIPLTQYEARLANAELAVVRADPDARMIAAEALELAEAGGHLLSATRLKELLEVVRDPRSPSMRSLPNQQDWDPEETSTFSAANYGAEAVPERLEP
jgi:DNA-binding SARP family transcriptional activator/DNA-binding transcriptional ArsR family regulator